MGEKGSYRVSRLASVVRPFAKIGLDVDRALVTRPAGPAMAPLPVPALFLTGLEEPLAQPAGRKPYTLVYPDRGQREKESGSTGAPQVRDD